MSIEESGPSIGRSLIEILKQPMLVLLIGAGAINFALADPLDGAVMFSFVLIVIAISAHQTWRTEKALRALQDLTAPTALVVRSGRHERIPSRDVVRGDRIVLNEGDRVPADANLVNGSNLTVDESLLTGESIPVVKSADGDREVFAGTLIGRGHAEAIVERIGDFTRLGAIGQEVKSIGRTKTRLQQKIDRVVWVIGLAAIVLASLVIIGYGLLRDSWLDGALIGIATAMSMLPEEFPVIFTVFLAVGAWRMSNQSVLVRRAPAIEALGSMSVACVDKTGTLTLNQMTPVELIVDDHHWYPSDGPPPIDVLRLIAIGSAACPLDVFDPIDKAFRSLALRFPDDEFHVVGQSPPLAEYPMSSELFATSYVWATDEGRLVASKGAPEAIAGLCRLSDVERSRIEDQVHEAAGRGLRILAVAHGRVLTTDLPVGQNGFDFRFDGLVCLKDPVRPGVSQSVAELSSASVRTIMMTGDHPATARSIAEEIGLDTSAGLLTGTEVDLLDDVSFDELVGRVNVFARTTPHHKLRLVRALQSRNEIVGMTGDGVNDAPALKAADIGVAMGGRGTDVAREAASIVIADDSFPSLVAGVERGRTIYDNIRKAFAYVISMHAPIVGLTTVPLFIPGWPIVLQPIQIAFLELIIDPACSIVFEAESGDPDLMKRPPRRPNQPILDRSTIGVALLQGAGVFAASFGLYAWAATTGKPDDVIRSIVFVSLVVGNVGLILSNRSWHLSIVRTIRERRNTALPWLLVTVTLVLTLLLTIGALRDAFEFGRISWAELALGVATGVLGSCGFEIYKRFRRGR